MKDSRIGTFGMAALVLTLLIKIAALNAFPIDLALVVLIGGHAFSRACAISLLFIGNYVGNSERSRAGIVAQPMSGGEFMFAAAIGLIPLIWCGTHALVGGICALAMLYVLGRWFIRRLGGFTGDTLGATQQLTEIASAPTNAEVMERARELARADGGGRDSDIVDVIREGRDR